MTDDNSGLDLFRTTTGIVAAHVLGAVVQLGLPDALEDGGTSVADAAARTGVEPDELARLLRAATVLGAVEQTTPGRYAPTPSGRTLRRDHPSGMYALVNLFSGPEFQASWAGLAEQVRTGEVAFDAALGQSFFERLTTRPEASASFNTAMRAWTVNVTGPLAAQGGFERFGTVVDVGGGNGTLLSEVLAAHPSLRGIVFDSPEGAAQAPPVLAAAGVADRCAIETGDFFRAVPAGGDAYLMKHIVHDWPDDRAATILRHCRDALPGHGRVLLVEAVLEDRPAPGTATLPYLMDIAMLVVGGGKERTRDEFDVLLRGAGLHLDGVTELAGTGLFLLEAVAI